MQNTKNYTIGMFAALVLTACGGMAGESSPPVELGANKEELQVHVGSYDPQHKNGVYWETGPFHCAVGGCGGNPTAFTAPFGAYVVWEGNNFALVSSFGALEPDLSLPDATTFPAANPAAPVIYEFAEDADCDWLVSATTNRVYCEATEQVYFTPGGGFVGPFNWKQTKFPDDAFFSFNSGDPGGNRVDAYSYQLTGEKCETAVERIVDFFDAQNVTFTVLELDAEELCD
jgi:hypothetical protein